MIPDEVLDAIRFLNHFAAAKTYRFANQDESLRLGEAMETIHAWLDTQPQQPEPDTDLRERLAAYAHDTWAYWMRYMFFQGETRQTKNGEGGIDRRWTMPMDKFHRWQRQMNTEYADLTEDEKESDRRQADRILALLPQPQQAGEWTPRVDIPHLVRDALEYMISYHYARVLPIEERRKLDAAEDWLHQQRRPEAQP